MVTSVKYIAFFVKESLPKVCDGTLGRLHNKIKDPEVRGKAKFKKHQAVQSSYIGKWDTSESRGQALGSLALIIVLME